MRKNQRGGNVQTGQSKSNTQNGLKGSGSTESSKKSWAGAVEAIFNFLTALIKFFTEWRKPGSWAVTVWTFSAAVDVLSKPISFILDVGPNVKDTLAEGISKLCEANPLIVMTLIICGTFIVLSMIYGVILVSYWRFGKGKGQNQRNTED